MTRKMKIKNMDENLLFLRKDKREFATHNSTRCTMKKVRTQSGSEVEHNVYVRREISYVTLVHFVLSKHAYVFLCWSLWKALIQQGFFKELSRIRTYREFNLNIFFLYTFSSFWWGWINNNRKNREKRKRIIKRKELYSSK